MKYLKSRKVFEDLDSPENTYVTLNDYRISIPSLCATFKIRNWSINSEGLVDVDGDVDLSYELYNSGIKKIPFNFGKVTGNFICQRNDLKSLEGSPREVGGDFNCEMNILTNLKGAPQSVGGDFKCSSWSLLSLEGIGHVGGKIVMIYDPCCPIYKPWINWSNRDYLLSQMEEYDFIRGNKILWDRFESFYLDNELDIPDKSDLSKYKIEY